MVPWQARPDHRRGAASAGSESRQLPHQGERQTARVLRPVFPQYDQCGQPFQVLLARHRVVIDRCCCVLCHCAAFTFVAFLISSAVRLSVVYWALLRNTIGSCSSQPSNKEIRAKQLVNNYLKAPTELLDTQFLTLVASVKLVRQAITGSSMNQ